MDAIRRSIVKSMILLPATAVVRPLVAQETSDLNWRRRFLVPSFSLPVWARNAPERLLYASTERGTWELYAWDRKTDVRRLVTAMDGSLASQNAQLDPNGEWIWWFEDTRGDASLGRAE